LLRGPLPLCLLPHLLQEWDDVKAREAGWCTTRSLLSFCALCGSATEAAGGVEYEGQVPGDPDLRPAWQGTTGVFFFTPRSGSCSSFVTQGVNEHSPSTFFLGLHRFVWSNTVPSPIDPQQDLFASFLMLPFCRLQEVFRRFFFNLSPTSLAGSPSVLVRRLRPFSPWLPPPLVFGQCSCSR